MLFIKCMNFLLIGLLVGFAIVNLACFVNAGWNAIFRPDKRNDDSIYFRLFASLRLKMQHRKYMKQGMTSDDAWNMIEEDMLSAKIKLLLKEKEETSRMYIATSEQRVRNDSHYKKMVNSLDVINLSEVQKTNIIAGIKDYVVDIKYRNK